MKRNKGFTLIELVVVMAIIAVLALLVVGAIIAARRTAANTTHRGNAKTIQTAAEALFAKNKSYSGLGASTQSFTAVKSTLSAALGTVTLAPTSCDSATATLNTNDGGGRVVYSSTAPVSWTITPVEYNCSTDMSVADRAILQ